MNDIDKLAEQFKNNPLINPYTGCKIKRNGPTQKKLKKEFFGINILTETEIENQMPEEYVLYKGDDDIYKLIKSIYGKNIMPLTTELARQIIKYNKDQIIYAIIFDIIPENKSIESRMSNLESFNLIKEVTDKDILKNDYSAFITSMCTLCAPYPGEWLDASDGDAVFAFIK